MKKYCIRILLAVCCTYCCANTVMSQGKFAGSLKTLIGKSFVIQKNIAGLNGYSLIESSVVSPVNDSTMFMASAYKKGNVFVVVFSKHEEGSSASVVIDVLEIRNAQSSWKVRTADCDNGNEGATNIVALVPTRKGKNDIVLKAWRCNMDKIRFDAMSTKLVHCSGDEQF